ncbi:putative GIY-YIG endonuclease [Plasmopara halstedii]
MIGSVYKIVCSQSDICYVGSTFNLLKHRMNGHRSNFKRWDEGKSTSEIAIFPYFRQYGPYEFRIILIKQYEVADRSQLRAYETLWINKFKKTCVNKVPPFGLLKRKRVQESTRKYWEANKEVLNENNKQFNELHKERLVEKITCECGGHYQYRGRTYHFESQKHIRWVEAQLMRIFFVFAHY